jgi:hypothetical protein
MKKNVIYACLLCGLMACKTGNQGNNTNVTDSLTTDTATDFSSESKAAIDKDGGIPIFYNMYLSVELSSLFKSVGATYDAKLTSSPDLADQLNTSSDKALNLGVYAVDLSYSKYFEQLDKAAKYLKTMSILSSDLGIPDDKFVKSVKRVEGNLANKDSLVRIANEIYKTVESNLKESDRASAAALIIVGGWTEAMYIATQTVSVKNQDFEFLQRIEDQKNSLDNLITLLDKYKTDIAVKEYINQLEDLKKSMDSLKIKPDNMGLTYKQLDEIKKKIKAIRNKIIG